MKLFSGIVVLIPNRTFFDNYFLSFITPSLYEIASHHNEIDMICHHVPKYRLLNDMSSVRLCGVKRCPAQK